MGKDIYKKFKAKERNYAAAIEPIKIWTVVTDDEKEIVIATIPTWIRHPKGVATALSSALSSSKFALTDLI